MGVAFHNLPFCLKPVLYKYILKRKGKKGRGRRQERRCRADTTWPSGVTSPNVPPFAPPPCVVPTVYGPGVGGGHLPPITPLRVPGMQPLGLFHPIHAGSCFHGGHQPWMMMPVLNPRTPPSMMLGMVAPPTEASVKMRKMRLHWQQPRTSSLCCDKPRGSLGSVKVEEFLGDRSRSLKWKLTIQLVKRRGMSGSNIQFRPIQRLACHG